MGIEIPDERTTGGGKEVSPLSLHREGTECLFLVPGRMIRFLDGLQIFKKTGIGSEK